MFFFQILIRDVYYTETDKVELLQLQVPEAQVLCRIRSSTIWKSETFE